MVKRAILFTLLAIVITIVVLAWIRLSSKDVLLSGNVRNAYSGQWVYGAKISVGGKIVYRYATTFFLVDGLLKGETTVKVQAPDYETQSFQIDLKRGENGIEDILLQPLRISDLKRIYVFARPQTNHYSLEIRFANSDNKAILHTPHLPVHVFCRLYIQTGEKNDRQKGDIVFLGHPEAIWDFEFDTIFPFSAKIRYKDITPVEAGKYVLDTICVFPKETVSLEENRKLFSKLDTINDAEQFLSTVEENRLQYYEDTTWDVMQDK